MRFLTSVLAVALSTVAVSANTPVSFTNALFNDPVTPDNTLLQVWVDTKCPQTISVQVNVPVGGINGNKFISGTDFGSQLFPGIADSQNGGTLESANIAASFSTTGAVLDGGATWTFTNFVDAQQLLPQVKPANFVNGNGYALFVDVPDYLFNNLPAQTPAGLGLNIQVNGQVQVSGNTAGYTNLFTVVQTSSTCGDNPPCNNPAGCGGSGDPIFNGFQGQNFQFHGLADEHFNLVSSPDVQLNSHFVYLSSGKCDYNDTECFTHPGTYMDVLGLSVGDSQVKFVAGSHEQGMRVWVNDVELQRGARIQQLSANVTGSLRYHHNGRVDVKTDIMALEIVNSDMFFNIRAGLNDQQLLRVGATKHTVTDKTICKTNIETHNHQLVEQTVAKKYPVTTQLHGLIGQTWRNVKVCGRDWMGTVQDYLSSSLFAQDYHYNYFKW
jgi:hypothetical protein